ncbi:MAG: phosphatidylinositol-specific phospholipase C domain-containing protein, partial [Bacilli bacterium]|nr:phosphatidylinositol-specific phospholipase C domain-containing protein [Bacilli bacterium]
MEIKKLRILIASIVSFVIILSAGLGFTGALRQKSNNTDYSSWMKDLADVTPIRNINMPGSHDTMALYSIGDLAGQCQSLSLEDQLNLGVRFLDIRLKEDNNELKAIHGFVDQRCSFKTITGTIEKFIKDNPSEMIIMSIKEEALSSNSSISFDESLKTYLKNNIYYLNQNLPLTLGEVRGKVILLSRYQNSSIGIPAFDGWKESTSFTLPNGIYVQDTYKITSKEQKQD